jgi:hypothetical protein
MFGSTSQGNVPWTVSTQTVHFLKLNKHVDQISRWQIEWLDLGVRHNLVAEFFFPSFFCLKIYFSFILQSTCYLVENLWVFCMCLSTRWWSWLRWRYTSMLHLSIWSVVPHALCFLLVVGNSIQWFCNFAREERCEDSFCPKMAWYLKKFSMCIESVKQHIQKLLLWKK